MRKNLASALFVLVGFAATGCATGGYLGPNPYPGPLGQVVAGNLALTCPGDYFVGAPINRCLGELGGNVGSYLGYPMYRGGMGGPQLSQADKLAVFCGLGGSGVAMLLDAGLKKTLGSGFVSAASCEVAGAILGRRGGRNNNKNVVVTPPAGQPQPQVRPQPQGQSVRWGADRIPVAVGARPGSPSSLGIGNQTRGLSRRAVNRTGMEVAVFRKGADPRSSEPIEVVPRNGSWQVPLSSEGYDVYVLIPTGTLGVQDVKKAAVVPNHDLTGWDIVVPAVQ